MGGIGGLVSIIEETPTGALKRILLPVQDGLGNVTALDQANGSVVARFDFGPYGEPLGESGEVDVCPFRYQTKFYDAESQHYYFGYRYYDPRFGRWLSRDPKGDAGGFNLYAYCGNDPVNGHDPLGLDTIMEDRISELFNSEIGKAYRNKDLALGGKLRKLQAKWIQMQCDYSLVFTLKDILVDKRTYAAGLDHLVDSAYSFARLSSPAGQALPGSAKPFQYFGAYEEDSKYDSAGLAVFSFGSLFVPIKGSASLNGLKEMPLVLRFSESKVGQFLLKERSFRIPFRPEFNAANNAGSRFSRTQWQAPGGRGTGQNYTVYQQNIDWTLEVDGLTNMQRAMNGGAPYIMKDERRGRTQTKPSSLSTGCPRSIV